MIHFLKIKAEYMEQKLLGNKKFEIRYNDRNFEVGDLVSYTVIDNDDMNERVKNYIYKITYVTDYEQKDGYVVFGDTLTEITKTNDFSYDFFV